MKPSPLGILLVNLGTPDAPTTTAIRRYLAEFLVDPRVVNIPQIIWRPILYSFILPFRPAKLVARYNAIWGNEGAPIRHYTAILAEKVEQSLNRQSIDQPERNNFIVKSAMTYGNPSLKSCLAELQQQGAQKLIIIPLFPQYSASTSAAVFDKLAKIFSQTRTLPDIHFLANYHLEPSYINAVVNSIKRVIKKELAADEMLLFSFHGLPQAQADAGDPYPQQCERTAAAIISQLGLRAPQSQITYQSRFGPAAWLQPYTCDVLADLPRQGIRKLFVVCPGFAVDCLETLQEIEVENRDIFMSAGGESYTYIPALNADELHSEVMVKLINSQLSLATAD
ncbi:MAG: ferrochelatase [Pseudomonadales bacterium]|nr:ferrochelatase [Pseudomonadales bacterium]